MCVCIIYVCLCDEGVPGCVWCILVDDTCSWHLFMTLRTYMYIKHLRTYMHACKWTNTHMHAYGDRHTQALRPWTREASSVSPHAPSCFPRRSTIEWWCLVCKDRIRLRIVCDGVLCAKDIYIFRTSHFARTFEELGHFSSISSTQSTCLNVHMCACICACIYMCICTYIYEYISYMY